MIKGRYMKEIQGKYTSAQIYANEIFDGVIKQTTADFMIEL